MYQVQHKQDKVHVDEIMCIVHEVEIQDLRELQHDIIVREVDQQPEPDKVSVNHEIVVMDE